MKKIALRIMAFFRSLDLAGKVRLVLVGLGLVLLAFLLFAHKPWQVDISPDKPVKISQYVAIFVWWALLVDFVLVVILAGTARFWARPFSPQVPTRIQFPKWFWPLVCLAMVISAVICWPRMNHSFWHDETYPIKNAILGNYKVNEDGSLKLRQATWTETLFFYKKPNHTLYSGIARVFNDVWRTFAKPKGLQFNEAATRLPSYIAGTLSVAAIALMLAEMEFFSAGALAAMLFAIHPWHIRYSSEARAYGFVLLLVPLLVFCFLRVVKAGTWKWWSFYGLTQFFLVWFYPTCIYVLLVANLCTIPALWWRWGKTSDAVTQGMRWLVTNIVAAMLFLPLILPCVPQFLAYVKTTGGQGTMSLEWLSNFLGHILAGIPWSYKGYYEPKQIELVWWFIENPGLGALIVFIALAFFVTGARRMFLKDRVSALVPWILILPAVLCFAETTARNGYIYVWYLLFMLPGAVALFAAGADEIFSGAKSRTAKIAAWVFVISILGSYTSWTSPQREGLRAHSIQPNRESVLATRPTLDPHDPRQINILTATFYGAPEPYDPNMKMIKTAKEIGELARQADAEGKDFYINLGYLTTVEGEHANKYNLLKNSGMFETVPISSGFEPNLLSRHVLKYRKGTAAGFDFESVPPDRGRPGSNYSY